MYQGTTPAIVYTISGVDLSAMKAFVSFKEGNTLLTKSGDEVSMSYSDETTTIVCLLSQEETLAFARGTVETQIRFIDSNGMAYATNKAKVRVDDIIYKAVISYGGDGE